MLEQFKYINSFDEVLEFGENGLFANENDLRDFAWEITSKNNRISNFKKGIIQKTIPTIIKCNSETEGIEMRNKLFEVFEKDITTKKHGKIQIGNSYLRCFITGNKKTQYLNNKNYMVATLTVTTDSAQWITEQAITIQSIYQHVEVEEGAKGYPHEYPYSYANANRATNMKIDHYADSDFQMIIYGPTSSVNIAINGHPYHVDYPIEANEYMVIDSRSFLPPEERLYLVKENGERINVFNYRDPVQSVFKKIPPGNISIDYSRLYGIDLTVFIERSEPKWS